MTETKQYHFSTSTARGLILGLRLGQIIGFICVILAAFTGMLFGNFILTVVLVMLAATTTLVRIPGTERTLLGWTYPLLRFVGLSTHHKISNNPTYLAQPTNRLSTHNKNTVSLTRLPELQGIRMESIPLYNSLGIDVGSTDLSLDSLDLGILIHKGISPMTPYRLVFVLTIEADGLQLLTPSEAVIRIDRWGTTIETIAKSLPDILQIDVIERATTGTQLQQDEAMLRQVPRMNSTNEVLRNAYSNAMTSIAKLSVSHNLHLAITVRGKSNKQEPDLSNMSNIVRSVVSILRNNQFRVSPLSSNQVAALISSCYNPSLGHDIATALSNRSVFDLSQIGPLYREVNIDKLISDGYQHASFYIMSWPGNAVDGRWLEPLLLGCPGVARTLAVGIQMIPVLNAPRRASIRRTDLENNLNQRAAKGFAVTSAQLQALDDAQRTEEELAQGYTLLRFGGVISLTCNKDDNLSRAVIELQQNAGQAGLTLSRLYGQQDTGFLATTPMGMLRFRPEIFD